MTKTQHFCLRWNNHVTNFVQVVAQLLKTETFADCTIAVDDGTTIKCHKLVLASCSTYFNELFIKNPCDHPMVILSDVKYHEIRAILEYMYRGEVNVLQEDLPSLLKIAYYLRVKGLVCYPNGGVMQMMDTERDEPALAMLSAAAAAAQAAAVEATNGHGSPLTNGYGSPPPHAAPPYGVPYVKPALDVHNAMALWPIPGMHQLPKHAVPGHPAPARAPFLAGSYEAIGDTSPLGRKKRSSYLANRDTPILRNVLGGQNEAPQSDRTETFNNNNSSSSNNNNNHSSNGNGNANGNGSGRYRDRGNSSDQSEPTQEEDDKPPTTPQKYAGQKEAPKPEWKRYKQYTRQHIADAMTAVKNKQMSALQAASKFGIPSRTLYDKLKKAGILPTRGAGVQRASRSDAASLTAASIALCAGSARFPYSGSLNGSVYGPVALNGISESESEHNGYELPASLSVTTSNGHAAPSEEMEVQADVNEEEESEEEDGAEDLSVSSRRSSGDNSVAAPPAVKEEVDDANMQHEES